MNFIEIAEIHRAIPLIYAKRCLFSAHLSTEINENLQQQAQNCSSKNLNFNAQLIKIVGLFEENKIEFLTYKGVALACLAYGDSSLRQFGDLDILIRKKDFPKVKHLILENEGQPALDFN